MKKIFNWVFGSFFRSVGRFLFWVLLGSVFAILISKLDLNISDFVLDNLLLRVNAAEVTYPSNSHVNFYGWKNKNDIGNSYVTLANVPLGDTFRFNNSTTPGLNTNWFVDGFANYVPYSYKNGNSYTIKFIVAFNSSVSLEEQLIGDGTSKFDIYGVTPSNSTYSNDYFSSTSYSYRKVSSANNNRFEFTFNFTTKADISNVRLRVMFYWGSAYCSYQNYDGYCGRSISNISYVSGSMSFEEGINSVIQNQTNIIENNFNNINNSINDLEDNLLNDELNDDDIQNVFDELEIEESSLNGFSNFLMVPLHWAETFLRPDQVCQPLQIPLPYLQNKNLTLPCMNDFWSRMGPLAALVDLVWLAVIGVRIFNGLFVLTIDVLSPKDNDDDLTKIKSWEL